MNYIWIAFWLLMGSLVISFIFLVLYNRFYNWHLEKHWKDGKYSGMSFPSMYGVLAILLIVLLFGTVVITSNRALENQDALVDHSFEIYECNEKEQDRQYSKLYMDAMKKGTLSGYKKYEKTKGDFLITSYVSTEEYDTMHPSLLVFVEYKGKKDYKFYTSRMELNLGKGEKQGSGQAVQKSEYYCTIINGDMNRLKNIDFELALYDDSEVQEKDYEDETYEHAVEVEKVKLEIEER